MTTWFAQKGSCNIDEFDSFYSTVWNDVANGSGNWMGNGSSSTFLNTLNASDVLVANGNTAIAINCDFTCETLTNAATGGTAAGQFTVTTASGNRNITCNIVGQDSGTATSCVSATLHATNRLTVTGNITGGGNVANARGMSIATTGGLLTVTGTITGGGHALAYGLASVSAHTIITVNNVTAGVGPGIYDAAGSGTAETVNGVVTASTSNAPAISCLGKVTMAAGSSIVSNATSWMFPIHASIKWETTDAGMPITLYDASGDPHIVKVPDYPAVADVESGVDYDYTTKTGTFAVPAEADVEVDVQYGAGGTEFTGTLAGGGSPRIGSYNGGVS